MSEFIRPLPGDHLGLPGSIIVVASDSVELVIRPLPGDHLGEPGYSDNRLGDAIGDDSGSGVSVARVGVGVGV